MKKYLILISLFLIIINATFADTGSPIRNVVRQDLFSNIGGLNTKSSPTNLQDNEASNLQNVYFDRHGAVLKRKGYSTYLTASVSTVSPTITGLVQFTTAAGTTYDIACSGRTIKYNSSGTWTQATGSLTAGNLFDIDIGDNYVVFTNNTNRIQYWSGTGNTQDLIPFSGFELARCLAYHQGFLFLGNPEISSVRYPSRIYYSTQGDILTWNAADFLNINENDGQPITGLAVSYGDLIIFKSDSIWKLSGYSGFSPATWALTKISSDVGCVATHSIINIENEIIWLGRKGVYGWTGNNIEYLSDKIQPEIEKLNKSRLEYAVSGHIRELNQYWLSASTSGSSTNDIAFVYDYKLGAWTKHTGINASYMATWLVSSVPTLISGNYSGYVFKQHSGNTDNGASIDAYYDTKWFNFGDPVHRKVFRRLTTIVNAEGAYNLDMYAYLDFKGEAIISSAPDVRAYSISLDSGAGKWGSVVWGQFTWGTGGELIREKNINESGYWIKYRFANPRANEPFSLWGFSQEAEIIN